MPVALAMPTERMKSPFMLCSIKPNTCLDAMLTKETGTGYQALLNYLRKMASKIKFLISIQLEFIHGEEMTLIQTIQVAKTTYVLK